MDAVFEVNIPLEGSCKIFKLLLTCCIKVYELEAELPLKDHARQVSKYD